MPSIPNKAAQDSNLKLHSGHSFSLPLKRVGFAIPRRSSKEFGDGRVPVAAAEPAAAPSPKISPSSSAIKSGTQRTLCSATMKRSRRKMTQPRLVSWHTQFPQGNKTQQAIPQYCTQALLVAFLVQCFSSLGLGRASGSEAGVRGLA